MSVQRTEEDDLRCIDLTLISLVQSGARNRQVRTVAKPALLITESAATRSWFMSESFEVPTRKDSSHSIREASMPSRSRGYDREARYLERMSDTFGEVGCNRTYRTMAFASNKDLCSFGSSNKTASAPEPDAVREGTVNSQMHTWCYLRGSLK